MLRLILVGSLLAIGLVTTVPDGLWDPNDPLNQNAVPEDDSKPRIPIPDNREAKEEVENMLNQLTGADDRNETDSSPRPQITNLLKSNRSGYDQSYANFGPKNSLLKKKTEIDSEPENGGNYTEEEDGYKDIHVSAPFFTFKPI